MSVHVTTQLKTRPEHTEQVVNKLREAGREPPVEGCEAIHIRRDQDDRGHIASFAQWATRHNYEDYLAWQTETGFRDRMEALLTVSQAGFDGDLDSRILSSGEETLRRHGPCEEVPDRTA